MREDTSRAIASEVQRLVKDRGSRIIQIDLDDADALGHLHEMGYTALYGTSGSRRVYDLPHYTSIRYIYCNSHSTHFPPSFFQCCISTRLKSQEELVAISEVLKKGGLALVKPAPGFDPARTGFRREGAVAASGLELYERVDEPGGRSSAGDGVSILSYSSGAGGGINDYTQLLRERISSCRMKADVVSEPSDVSGSTVVIEYANGLAKGARLMGDVALLSARGKRVVVEVHDTLERFEPAERLRLQTLCTLVYRANEGAERDGVARYTLMPHISYTNIPQSPFESVRGPVLGSFGFAARYKRTGMLIRLAKKLAVPLDLMLSLNEETGIEKSMKALKELEPEFGLPLPGEGEYSADGVRVRVGFFESSEIAREMATCSHIVFAHTSSNFHHSGVMTMAKRFARPIVAVDSFQARQAQVVRVKSFTKLGAIRDAGRSFGAALLHRRLELGRLLYDVSGIISEESLSSGFLSEHSRDLSRDEDGFDYMTAIIEEMG